MRGTILKNDFALFPKVCYDDFMATSLKIVKASAVPKLVLGQERFTKISAVEGVVVTAEMKKRVKEFDRLGLSPAERRREILKVCRKKA